jgi:hypothetical protein
VLVIVGYFYVFVPLLKPSAVQAGPTAAEIIEGKKQDAQRLRDMRVLQHALAAYFKDHMAYPPKPAGTTCPGFDGVRGLTHDLVPSYVAAVPEDPKPASCQYDYYYWSDDKSYAILVHLSDIDPAKYRDRWCIGASAGSMPAITGHLPCP